jgi:enamine deaminase RidA (YjgF/YER057c/UK114 family)
MTFKFAAAALALAAVCASGAQAQVVRTGAPTAIIASSATVPAGYETVYLSGTLPDAPAAGQPAGNAEAQANNVFTKVGASLKALGLSEADVVHMTIYMATPDGSVMDFAGMMKAYTKFYGTATQPMKPTRSTVQVLHLAQPTALLEVEVTAARKAK